MKILSTILMAVLFMGNGDKYTETQRLVDSVNVTAPARTWDGQYLKTVQLDISKNVVVFYLKNVGGRLSSKEGLSQQKKSEEAAYIVANFMTAYDYSINGKGGEGDEELFKKIGPLLKQMARNDIGICFNLEYRRGGTITLELTPSELERAVLLRKKDFY